MMAKGCALWHLIFLFQLNIIIFQDYFRWAPMIRRHKIFFTLNILHYFTLQRLKIFFLQLFKKWHVAHWKSSPDIMNKTFAKKGFGLKTLYILIFSRSTSGVERKSQQRSTENRASESWTQLCKHQIPQPEYQSPQYSHSVSTSASRLSTSSSKWWTWVSLQLFQCNA